MIESMNHFTVLTDDLERTLGFYVDGLGFQMGPRPPFDFPGAWLYVDGRPILHVVAGRKLPEPRAGVLDHMAFSAVGLTDTVRKLEQKGLKYSLGRQVETGVWQLFFHDPNGARVELDFTATEQGPA